ncbi:MAG: ABC transporter ATP-binding protein [Bacteroidales bacterium]
MADKLIEMRSVYAGYGNAVILRDVDLDIYSDDFIGVIGPNGGGKTTLIKTILGLIKPRKGKVSYMFDRDRHAIGYLPQLHKFDPRFPIKVCEVVLSGLYDNRLRPSIYRRKDRMKAMELLESMNIQDLAKMPIGELSGGQMQRTFLCRAIISDPILLILDEPNTYVDNKFEHDLYDRLKDLNKRMAILLVSHDIGTISYYIKSIACVNHKVHYHGSGKITQDQLAAYDCPIQIITHGAVPHTVLKTHQDELDTE